MMVHQSVVLILFVCVCVLYKCSHLHSSCHPTPPRSVNISDVGDMAAFQTRHLSGRRGQTTEPRSPSSTIVSHGRMFTTHQHLQKNDLIQNGSESIKRQKDRSVLMISKPNNIILRQWT